MRNIQQYDVDEQIFCICKFAPKFESNIIESALKKLIHMCSNTDKIHYNNFIFETLTYAIQFRLSIDTLKLIESKKYIMVDI